jgi:hypothetical protein
VEAITWSTVEGCGLLALILAHNRQAHQPYPVVFQDSTALPVCKRARASQHRTFRDWAQIQERQWVIVRVRDPRPVR